MLAPAEGFVPYVPPVAGPDAGWLWVSVAYGLGLLIPAVYAFLLAWRLRRHKASTHA